MINTVVRYLQRTAVRFPNKIAFRDERECVTFAELDRRAHSLACIIHQKLNGRIKQPVGIYLPKGISCVTAFIGVAYSGNYYTPLDTATPKERLEKITGVLAPALIITDSNHQEDVSAYSSVLINQLEQAPPENGILCGILDTVIDTDILYVMFTSGSTGAPKGVIVTHRAVIDYMDWLTDTFAFDENTVFGNQAPFYFDNSVLDIYSTLANGCETIIIPEEKFLSGMRLCTFLKDEGVNTIFWVPSAMALAANSGALEKVPLGQLKKVLFAGEVMPVRLLNIWRKHIPDALYANLYGPTEIAVDCTCYIVDREFDDTENLPIGMACRNTGILVLNEKNEPAVMGEIGELCVRGSCLAHGYYGDPVRTQTAFVQNPLNDKYPEKIYRTGDLVQYNDRGELLFIGRKDHQIKHRGYRIELGEIETAASSAPGVKSCCAIYDDERKRIVIYAAPEALDKKALYAHLKHLLPQYMLPGLIMVEKALPLNKNGKIDRQVLKGRLKEGL